MMFSARNLGRTQLKGSSISYGIFWICLENPKTAALPCPVPWLEGWAQGLLMWSSQQGSQPVSVMAQGSKSNCSKKQKVKANALKAQAGKLKQHHFCYILSEESSNPLRLQGKSHRPPPCNGKSAKEFVAVFNFPKHPCPPRFKVWGIHKVLFGFSFPK